jgi:hypothetical protein
MIVSDFKKVKTTSVGKENWHKSFLFCIFAFSKTKGKLLVKR